MDFEKREVAPNSKMWLPKAENESLIGEITKVIEGKYGKQYLICTDAVTGAEIVTPSHKVLQNRMEGLTVGTVVKIVYLGKEPPAVRGQNPMQMYDVYTKK